MTGLLTNHFYPCTLPSRQMGEQNIYEHLKTSFEWLLIKQAGEGLLEVNVEEPSRRENVVYKLHSERNCTNRNAMEIFPRQHPVELMKLIGKLRNHLRAANGWNCCTFPFNRAADDDRRHSKTMKWELNESVLELKLENDAKARTLFPPV